MVVGKIMILKKNKLKALTGDASSRKFFRKFYDNKKSKVIVVSKKEKFNQIPRLTLSTIHAAKGGEADNVLLLPDITKSAVDNNDRDPDELHRSFYVAVTRAKQSLHILEPKNYDRAYIL